MMGTNVSIIIITALAISETSIILSLGSRVGRNGTYLNTEDRDAE